MPFLIAGLLILWFTSVGLKSFVRANPAALAGILRQGGGLLAIVVAIVLLLRGQLDLAIVLAAGGFWFLGGGHANRPWFGFRRPKARRVSRVRSAMIEMELDHASGAMTGTVLAGPEEGAALDRLTRPRCFDLYGRCLRDDPEGARLLEAYFDRRFAGWRQAEHGGGDTRGTGPTDRGGRPSMSEDEAHEILGLGKSATREDITRAHRALMKKLHPDHGGSTNLAARVNEAKDVLLRRHP